MISLIVIALCAILFYEFYWKRRNYPPGPTPLPILGNLLTIYWMEPGYDAFLMWKKKYGPVYTIWFGNVPQILITDYPTIKETIIKEGDKYVDRYTIDAVQELVRGGNYGVIETSGPLWRDQRRFTLHLLRDFGMGKNGMEARVLFEIETMFERISKQTDVKINDELNIAVGSIINMILFGYRFDDDKLDEFFSLKHLLSNQMKEFSHPATLLCFLFPWMRSFPMFKNKWAGVTNYIDNLFGFFKCQIAERESIVNLENEEGGDFVDCFLREKHKRRDELDCGGYSSKQLQNLVFDLWIAGLETTSNTLTFAFVYILNNPEVQRKLHEELDREIGRNRKTVALSDRNQLTYVNAVVCEVQRLANLLPLNLMRETTEEVEIKGIKYPKGTIVIPQISCVLYDEDIFPDPYKFDPSRFIDENGKLKKYEELIPFSIGKRQCIGEGLARMELFLFTANIFHRFEVSSEKPPSMKKFPGTTVQAHEFNCRFTPRI